MKLHTHKKQMLQEETLYDNYNIKKEWNEKNVMSLKNGDCVRTSWTWIQSCNHHITITLAF